MHHKITMYLMAFVLSVLTVIAGEGRLRHVEILVVDEIGRPVSGATVRTSNFGRQEHRTGATDGNGMYIYDDYLTTAIYCFIDKIGFYHTGGELWHWRQMAGDYPTNTISVVLKQIVDPVPISVRRIRTYLPRLNEPVGFDLNVGDWVNPFGAGTTNDIWIVGEKRYISRKDHDIKVTISFSNALDGIQEFIANDPDESALASDLIPPHVAPSNGYTNVVYLWQSWHPKTPLAERYRAGRNYIFRVRSKIDNASKPEIANYGWTRGDIKIDTEDNKTIWVNFQYFYNSNPCSRSLETKEIADRQWKVEKR